MSDLITVKCGNCEAFLTMVPSNVDLKQAVPCRCGHETTITIEGGVVTTETRNPSGG